MGGMSQQEAKRPKELEKEKAAPVESLAEPTQTHGRPPARHAPRPRVPRIGAARLRRP